MADCVDPVTDSTIRPHASVRGWLRQLPALRQATPSRNLSRDGSLMKSSEPRKDKAAQKYAPDSGSSRSAWAESTAPPSQGQMPSHTSKLPHDVIGALGSPTVRAALKQWFQSNVAAVDSDGGAGSGGDDLSKDLVRMDDFDFMRFCTSVCDMEESLLLDLFDAFDPASTGSIEFGQWLLVVQLFAASQSQQLLRFLAQSAQPLFHALKTTNAPGPSLAALIQLCGGVGISADTIIDILKKTEQPLEQPVDGLETFEKILKNIFGTQVNDSTRSRSDLQEGSDVAQEELPHGDATNLTLGQVDSKLSKGCCADCRCVVC